MSKKNNGEKKERETDYDAQNHTRKMKALLGLVLRCQK